MDHDGKIWSASPTLQNGDVSPASPMDGYVLVWNDSASMLSPQAQDGYLLQSDPLPSKTADGFLKRNAGNTGWEEVVYGSTANTVCEGDDSRLSDSREPTGSASGDLSGTYPGPTVAAIQGNPFSEVAPLDGYVPAWNAAAGKWSPQIQDGYLLQTDPLPAKTADGFLKRNAGNTGWEEVVYGSAGNTVCEGDDSRLSDSREPTGSASGDLSGTYPSPTVAAIQGRSFSETAPLDGYVPAWNAAAGKWSPQIQDGYWPRGDPLPVKIASGFLKRDPANTNWDAQYKSTERTKPMNHSDTLGMSVNSEVVQIKKGNITNTIASVPTEVPLTIVANDEEIATLSGSPDHLREFVYGFLFTSGFIQGAHDIRSFFCDETKWQIEVKLNNPPEPNLLTKRLYTSGCGRGVMFSSVVELALRRPLADEFTIESDAIPGLVRWLQTSSQLYRSTRGVHTAALSKGGVLPEVVCDDIGRVMRLTKS